MDCLHLDPPPDLLARARAGERAAWAELYALAAPAMLRLLTRVTPQAAEDLLHDAFLDVVRGLPAYAGNAPFGAWVQRVTAHRALQHLRSPWQRARAWLAPEPGEGDADDEARWPSPVPGARSGARISARTPAEALDLEQALGRLSPLSRAVVWLHDVEGLTHAEIGAALGRTPSFSKSQLSRAHLQLRDWLRDYAAAAGELA